MNPSYLKALTKDELLALERFLESSDPKELQGISATGLKAVEGFLTPGEADVVSGTEVFTRGFGEAFQRPFRMVGEGLKATGLLDPSEVDDTPEIERQRQQRLAEAEHPVGSLLSQLGGEVFTPTNWLGGRFLTNLLINTGQNAAEFAIDSPSPEFGTPKSEIGKVLKDYGLADTDEETPITRALFGGLMGAGATAGLGIVGKIFSKAPKTGAGKVDDAVEEAVEVSSRVKGNVTTLEDPMFGRGPDSVIEPGPTNLTTLEEPLFGRMGYEAPKPSRYDELVDKVEKDPEDIKNYASTVRELAEESGLQPNEVMENVQVDVKIKNIAVKNGLDPKALSAMDFDDMADFVERAVRNNDIDLRGC